MIQHRIKMERLQELINLIDDIMEIMPLMGQNARLEIIKEYAYRISNNHFEYDEIIKYIGRKLDAN